MASLKPLFTILAFVALSLLLPPAAAAAITSAPSDIIVRACRNTSLISELEGPCVQTFTSDTRTASASTVPALARTAIAISIEKASATWLLIQKTRKQPPGPRPPLKSALKYCAFHYKDVVGSLKRADQWLQKDQDEVDNMIVDARDRTQYCREFLTNANALETPISRANEEVNRYVLFASCVTDLMRSITN